MTEIILKAKDLKIHEREVRKQKPDPETFTYPFGKLFTDHMLTFDYDLSQGGWFNSPTIEPYGPIKFSTSATCLHYGVSAYEGFSVLQNSSTGDLQAFRVADNL